MNLSIPILLLAASALVGCTHGQTAKRGSEYNTRDRVVYTGSNIPRPRNELTPYPLSATTPAGSVARRAGSLGPTEPVVGATNNAQPGDDTGPLRDTAGPAGSR